MHKRTFWIIIVILLLVPILPTIYTVINNILGSVGLKEVDDWLYSGDTFGSQLMMFWSLSDFAGRTVVILITILTIGYLGFPVYRFVKNLLTKGDTLEPDLESGQDNRPIWKWHRAWLGLPAVYLVFLGYLAWLIFAFKLNRSLFSPIAANELYLSLAFGIAAIVFLLLVARLFVIGLYHWLKKDASQSIKTIGRGKFLFSFYYLVLIILLAPSLFNHNNDGAVLSSNFVSTHLPGLVKVFNTEDYSIEPVIQTTNTINNFRDDIKNDYLPMPTDLTHKGIFQGYTFATDPDKDCEVLLCPSYGVAATKDPFSDKIEHFLAIGLNPNIDRKIFKRKKINLVVLLDISGSMKSSFNRLRAGKDNSVVVSKFDDRSKMEIVSEVVATVLDQLDKDDRLGVVLFDSDAHIARSLSDLEGVDVDVIKDNILKLNPGGGTNLTAGYLVGTELFKNQPNDKHENRIILLTDAVPRQATAEKKDLLELTKVNAEKGIYTSFIAIGTDFNTESVQKINQIRGANYYPVHSAEELTSRMVDGFDYTVTPLVFDLKLNLKSTTYDIRAIYGSQTANPTTGELMKINTLFPPDKTETETQSNLIMVHLDKVEADNKIVLSISYKNSNGLETANEQEIEFIDSGEYEYFTNASIHKGVVLSRYVNTIKDWLLYETGLSPKIQTKSTLQRYNQTGIPTKMTVIEPDANQKRMVKKLSLATEYYPIMVTLRDYLAKEIGAIADTAMNQEVELLDKIISVGYSF